MISIGIIIVAIIGATFDLDNSKILRRIEQKVFFGRELKCILHTIHYYKDSKLTILMVIFLSYLIQILMVSVSLFIASAIITDGADLKMLILIPLGYFANALPVTPGGIGVGEAAMESLFNLFSLQGGAEVILGWRNIMVILGVAGITYCLKGEKRLIFNDT